MIAYVFTFAVGAICGFIGLGIFATGTRELQRPVKVLPFPRHPRRAA